MEVASPTHGSHYNSAPSSPTRLTELCGFDEYLMSAVAGSNRRNPCLATVPFAWEEKPGVPKTPTSLTFQDEFSFDVGFDRTDSVIPADDLFHGGVIKPFGGHGHQVERERGRERVSSSSSSSGLASSRSRRTRSLSPLGSSDHRREQHEQRERRQVNAAGYTMAQLDLSSSTASASENGSKRWSFMDLLLFRSASDGRAMDKDPLKKYSAIFRKHDQDIRSSHGSGTGSTSKQRGRVSAHEHHYAVNRAVSNDMKKKTYLPYKQGLLGRFSFNP